MKITGNQLAAIFIISMLVYGIIDLIVADPSCTSKEEQAKAETYELCIESYKEAVKAGLKDNLPNCVR